MEKLKPKRQPKNFFHYFLDEYILFRRDFYFELDVSPEIIEDRIHQLYEVKRKWWGNQEKIIPTTEYLDELIYFKVIRQPPGKHNDYRTAKAKGVIYEENGISCIEGCVMMSGIDFWLSLLIPFTVLIAITLGLFPVGSISPEVWRSTLLPVFLIALLFIGTIGFLFMYHDRNHLYNLIQSAVESSYEQSDKAKAS